MLRFLLTGFYDVVINNPVGVSGRRSRQLVIANEDGNPDLFFGIRGGGCNFEIVTLFVLGLHPQRRSVYAAFSCIRRCLSNRYSVFGVLKDLWPKTNKKEAHLAFHANDPNGEVRIHLTRCSNSLISFHSISQYAPSFTTVR